MSPTSSLSGQTLLVMQQVTGFMSNDFAIENGEGNVVAHGHTRGSAASRMFRGNRQFEIEDLDGTPLFRVEDPMTFGRDRYRLTGPQGSQSPRLSSGSPSSAPPWRSPWWTARICSWMVRCPGSRSA